MTALIVDAAARIEANERLLLATRHLLSVSRRVLYYPHLTMAGGSGETDAQSIRRMVRARLTSGALWPIRGSMQWSGHGAGQRCCVCGKPVGSSDVEYEVDDGRPRLPSCHFACFVVWHEESRTFKGYDGNIC